MKVLFTFLAGALAVSALRIEGGTGCYKNTTVRGAGVPLSSCGNGLERSGLLCYPTCRDGFYGEGPVCWQKCESPYTDTGAFCQQAIKWGDNSACPVYDKCGLTFSRGCVKCADGFSPSGCLCTNGKTFAKASYGRGVGTPLTCASGLQDDAGLCYPPCPASFNGLGPVCWAGCPADQPYSCGAFCLKDSQQCADKIQEAANDVLALGVDIAKCITTHGASCDIDTLEAAIKKIIDDFALPICSA